ncbi:MAG TPA: cation-translocating P-type ATPase, partial [Mycobacterium sp.]|nr:cation-translocating P-type ATPase [Mycobacterium sp.]
MDVTQLLRQSAALPLRAAAAGVSVTSSVVGTAVSGGVALATTPAREAAGLVSSLANGDSPARIAAEFLGGTPSRRCWRGRGRAWIEVRGLGDREGGRVLGARVVKAVRAHPGVESAVLNYPTSRLVVSLNADAPSLRALCELVASAETDASKSEPARHPARDLPGDPIVLAARMVALTANVAGLGVALAGRAVPWVRLPVGLAATVTVVDYQPRLRAVLENRLGQSVTDTVLAVAGAAVYTITQSPTSLAADSLLHLARLAEARSAARAWAAHEPALARQADCADALPAAPAREPRPGPVEKHADRSALAQLIGATALGAASRSLSAAATATLVTAPKAARGARESFAATLGRGLADKHHVLALRPQAWRRLDRIDAVLIDPRALSTDELRVSRMRGAAEQDRAAVWEWARMQVESGLLAPGWHPVGGRWSTNGDRNAAVGIFIRNAHHPLASAVVGEARRSGAEVVSLDVDALDDLRSAFDDLRPMNGDSVDTALADAVGQLQRDGRNVAVLATDAPQALSLADVAIGIMRNGDRPPWYAHLLVDDLAGAWRVLHCLPAARTASRRGVDISAAASLLGALLMVPGVRGRGPGPVTAGATAGLWTGFSLARRAIGASVPAGAATDDWHAMSPEQVRRALPQPADEVDARPPVSPTSATGVTDRLIGSPRRVMGEVLGAMRGELSDPLTPILATGSAASALLGSPVDAVLVGSVLTFNSALAASQQVRAERLLRRLLAVQVPSARRVLEDPTGTRRYADTEAARLRPGDLIEVRPSEVVPADARLLEAVDLEVDESSLTGESLPVIKQVDATPGATLAERSCMVFAATTVVAGTGVAVVTAVGPQTQARRAAEVPRSDGSAVGLQTQLRDLTNRAWPISLAGGVLVSGLALVRRASLRQAVASGVAVTVAAVPEGLALVATLAQ